MKIKERLIDELYAMCPDVSIDSITEAVERVLEDPRFDRKTVERYDRYCIRCGVCCEKVPDRCIHLSEKGYCKIYNERANVCRDWPYWEVDGDYGIQVVDYCEQIYKILLYELWQKMR